MKYLVGASVGLDARELDHLGPLLGIVGDKSAEIGGRTGGIHRCAEIGKPCLHRRIGKGGIYLYVELINDPYRRVFWCADAGSETCLQSRHEFGHNGNVGQRSGAGCTHHCQRAQPAGSDVFD